MIKIAILGSTGSAGKTTINIVNNNKKILNCFISQYKYKNFI